MTTITISPPAQPPGILQAQSLQGLLPDLVHGFSTNFLFEYNPSVAATIQKLIGKNLGRDVPAPIMLEQPHSANILELENGGSASVEVVEKGEHGSFLKGFDGATSSLAAPALLGVRAADCVPVLAAHPGLGAYAALHAGWRGTAAGILPKLLRKWQAQGGNPAEVRLALGPGIRECCFEVKSDCLSQFQPEHLTDAVRQKDGGLHLDLVQVLISQARSMNISPEQVEVLPYCTFCHQGGDSEHPFASYRRNGRLKQPTDGRNLGFIGIAS